MSLIDPRENFGQVSWLTVKGRPDEEKDRLSGGIVGRTTFADRTFSLLARMGLGVNDLLRIGRRIGDTSFVQLDLWQSSRMFDSLLLSGPRWYAQPGQKSETWHQLYITWVARRAKHFENNLLNIGLEEPWKAHMSRGAQGLMIGQAVVNGELLTHMTLVDYLLKGEDETDSRLCFKIENLVFPNQEPPRWLHPGTMNHVKETLALFEQHCVPSDIGNKPPYWETLQSDAVAEWQLRADQYRTWYEAAVDIHTPWDFSTYCTAFASKAGAAKGDPAKLHIRMMQRLRRHLSQERMDELDALQQLNQQLELLLAPQS